MVFSWGGSVKLLFFHLGIFIAGQGWASFPTPEAVITEVLKYSPSTPLTKEYAAALDAKVQSLTMSSETKFKTNESQDCKNSISINEIGNLTGSKTPEALTFESGFIRLEVIHCFDRSVEPEKILRLIESVEFKRKAFPNLITALEAKNDGRRVVYNETTNTPMKGASSYVYTVVPLTAEPDYELTETRLLSNSRDIKSFPNPIYFRYTLTAAKRLRSATALHIVSYTRAGDLTGIPTFVLKSAIQSAQMKFINTISSSLSVEAR